MTADPAAFLASLIAAVNRHDIDALSGLFAEDYVNETPAHPSRGFTGRDQVRRNWTTIFSALPDVTVTAPAYTVADDTVWAEWALDGTRADGVRQAMRGVIIFTVADKVATAARFYVEPLDREQTSVDQAVAGHIGAEPSR
jgi:ketosteroid isomerase-like protein